jgi:DNA-binding response OmpR family regulator
VASQHMNTFRSPIRPEEEPDPDATHPGTDGQRVLLIDDDRKLGRLLAEYLKPLGYQVEVVHEGPAGVERALSGTWAAVLLDVMLPGMDGFEVLRRIRTKSGVPVLMLTARGDEADRIVGLEMGADDYLPKTFSTRELLARLRAVIRRAAPGPGAGATDGSADETGEPDIVVGPLRLSPSSRTAAMGDTPLVLTPVEYDILLALVRAKGRIKTREQLIDQVRDREYDVFDRSVDVHVSALRRKLGDDPKEPRYIRTVRSAGYMFVG